MRRVRGGRRSRVVRRSPLIPGVLVVAGIFALTLWPTPPPWLVQTRRAVLFALQWPQSHILNVNVAGLIVAVTGLVVAVVVPLMIAFRQRDWARRDNADERRRAQNRRVMLQRVRNNWIKGVLERSLINSVELNLRLRPWPVHQQGGGSQCDPLLPDTPISTVFLETGGGLLILGAPGSGKTTELLKLARDLIDQAEADSERPIPVVFNLSSWSARRPPLAEWLVDELHKNYDVPKSTAIQWVEGGEILPLFDGLDEVVDAYRAECVDAIKVFHQRDGLIQFVVCSRTQAYTALSDQLPVVAVELEPLTRQQIYDYLASTTSSGAREAFEVDEVFWALLQSPLALNIAALTYQERPVDAFRTPGTPEQRLATLFESYTQRMLERRLGYYSPDQMLSSLTWLAQSMRDRSQSEFQLDRLQPDWLPTKTQKRLAVLMLTISTGLIAGLIDGVIYALVYGVSRGLMNGLAIGLFFAMFVGIGHTKPGDGFRWSWPRTRTGLLGGLTLGLVDWLIFSPVDGMVFGLAFGLLFIFFAGLKKTDPVEQVGWSWSRANTGLLVGSILGLAIGLVYGIAYRLVSGPISTVVFGLVFALAIGLFGGLATGSVPALVDQRATPNEGIHRSARRALTSVLISGLVVGLVFGLSFKLIFDLPHGLGGGLRNGLVIGLAVGLLIGGLACLQHFIVRGLLAYNGLAPLNYVRFLDEAVDRLFLRRTGSGYIFVHRLLRDYFADLNATSKPHARIENPVVLSG